MEMDEGSQTVIAPGGPRPADSVRHVGPDEVLRQSPDGTLDVLPREQGGPGEPVGPDEEMVLTPGGYRPASKVRLVPPDPALSWTPVNSVTDTGQHTVVVNNANPGGSVDVYYNEYLEWVTSLYADLLSRAPDATGLRNWTNLLVLGPKVGLDPPAVASGFLRSAEYCTRTITALYRQLLDRPPDARGLQNWVGAMQTGVPEQRIIAGFCLSQEYQNANPLPAAFVESLYVRLLGRASDKAGKDGWIAALQASGKGRVVDGFLRSREYCERRVTDLYRRYLGRQPDPAGLADWAGTMTSGTSFQQVQSGFLLSAEYRARALLRFP